jgi:segregation and condensation protein B
VAEESEDADVIAEAPPTEIEADAEIDVENVELDPFGRAILPWGVGEAEPEDLVTSLEAICFALNRPLTVQEASEILGSTPAKMRQVAELLAQALTNRGLMLQRHNDELQMVTRGEVAWAVQRALNPEKPSRLSQAALETLAIIAYRQPTTRAVIEFIRGVNCDAVIDSLERRGLIEEVGRQDSPGQPRLFGTTLRFLQLVGLEKIGDLPQMPGAHNFPDAWRDIESPAEVVAVEESAGDDVAAEVSEVTAD